MFKVELKIYHKSCWGSDIGVKFPSYEFSSIDCRWIDNTVVHIVHARGETKGFSKILTYFKKRIDVKKVELLSKDDQSLYLRISTKKDKHTSQFSDIFFSYDCFLVVPTRFEGKYEIWTLGSSKKKNISLVYEELKKKHPVTLIYLKEESMVKSLTKKQREVLNYAHYFGYYEWPRKKTITEICDLVNIPKTVFLSHLRKAEQKIISSFLIRKK